jgi:hypothetical protein
MNKNTNHNEDKIVRELFQNNFKPEDTPSANFKTRVMDRVMSEWVARSNYYEPILDKSTRWWLIPGIMALFAIGYFIDMGQMSRSHISEAVGKLGTAFEALYAWIEPIHLLVIVSLLAAGLLLGADHLLRKLSNI